MKKKLSTEAFLANSVVTQNLIEEYRNNIPALATEVRLMEANPEWRDSIALLRYYRKALQILVEHEELMARYEKQYGKANREYRQHPENGMD